MERNLYLVSRTGKGLRNTAIKSIKTCSITIAGYYCMTQVEKSPLPCGNIDRSNLWLL